MKSLTIEDLDIMEARAKATSPDPIKVFKYGDNGGRIYTGWTISIDSITKNPNIKGQTTNIIADFYNATDLEFYCHAKADILMLIEKLKELLYPGSTLPRAHELVNDLKDLQSFKDALKSIDVIAELSP